MARLLSNSIPNLLNGVSQQPDTVRLANQASIQENASSDVVFGLGKRNPTEHIAKLNNDTNTNSKVHIVNRDTSEQYIVLIKDQNIQVFDLNGVQKTVTAPSGLTYLTSTNPALDINLVSVADYTFVCNKTKVTEMSNTLTTTRPFEAIYYVKNGQYATTYTITVNGSQVASFTTLDNSSSGNASSITTDNIATQLYNGLTSSLSGYTIVRDGSIIYISHPTVDFITETTDGLGGDGLIKFKEKTNSFVDLPYKGYTGFHIEITGDGGTEYDNYYVYWDGTAWVETVKKGLKDNFNTATLPHLLIRQADGNFRFVPADGSTYVLGGTTYTVPTFTGRLAGDEITAPDPTFIGRKIQDIFFFRNRLGYLSDENVIFSKSGEFFTFYPETVTTLLDDDPIDLAVSHNRVSILKYAVPFSEELILFSDQTQFILKPQEILSSKTVSINQATEYEIDVKSKPLGLGQNVYFCNKRGSYAGVREYYINNDTDTKDALDISINIPRYIEGSVFDLKGSGTENTLFALSDVVRNEIYVYRYYFDTNGKPLQRSWSKYKFSDDTVILGGDCIENIYHLVIKKPDGTYLINLNLKTNEVETNLNFTVYLDRKTKVTGVYNSVNNQTTWTLPYQETGEKGIVLSGDWPSQFRGRNITVLSHTSTTIVALGDYSAHPAFVGIKYNMKYKFSKIFVREQKASGSNTSVNTGRLQIKRMSLIYGDTGYFDVTIFPRARNSANYKFTGQILGSSNFVLGNPTLESGEFKFPIMCRNIDVDIEINNDSYLPCNFLSAEWEGMFSVLTERSMN
jgi:hypothetical protein